jgi:hypothetical protein
MHAGTSPPNVQSPPGPELSGAERTALPLRAPYEPPVLERLGPWEAFTLQMSIPIFP